MQIQAMAPGKLTVMGEFGVVQGGPVLVMAVNRYATASLSDNPDGHTVLVLPSDSGSQGEVELPNYQGGGYAALISATVNSVKGYLQSRGHAAPPMTITLSTDENTDKALKGGLGFGSAASVAVAAAFLRASGLPVDTASGRWDLLTIVAYARSLVLGFAASGADVAPSVYGGLLSYIKGGSCERIPLPDGLHWKAVHKPGGKTGSIILPRLDAVTEEEEQRRHRIMADMAQLANQASKALKDRNATAFLSITKSYGDALGRLESEYRTTLTSATMRRLCALATERGGAVKPIAVEGGELGLVFATDEGTLGAITDQCTSEGLHPISLAMDPQGVVCPMDMGENASDLQDP